MAYKTSSYPESLDTFSDKIDISESDVVDIGKLQTLKLKENKLSSEIEELNRLLEKYKNKIFTAGEQNKLQDAIVSVQNFTKDTITNYYQNRGQFSASIKYNIYNCVVYGGNTYMLYNINGYSEGILPTNTQYFMMIGSNGRSVQYASMYNTMKLTQTVNTLTIIGQEITAYNSTNDTISVYVNGTYLVKGADYNVTSDGLSIQKVVGSWTLGDTICINVVKNVISIIEFNDGNLLQNGSVTVDKLNSAIQSKINSIAGLLADVLALKSDFANLTLNTYTKTDCDVKFQTRGDYAYASHNHNSVYYLKSEVYTKSESDNRYQTKGNYASSSHDHNGAYYTKGESDDRYRPSNWIPSASDVGAMPSSKITVSQTQPSNPAYGDIWITW